MRRKLLSLALVFTIIFTLLLPVCSAQSIGVTIDGSAITFTQSSGSPFIDGNSRTLVPLRVVMEAYGCTVGWESQTSTASVSLGDTTVLVTIGQKQISINGSATAIDAAAQIKDGRTYLPIRAVLEAFGATVGWDGNTRTVTVQHPKTTGLNVHFLDVGQADCILIIADGNAMLIDAGNNADAAVISAYLRKQGITELQYVVGTHPHEDHIGALDDVLYTFDVQKVLMPKIQTNTKTFEDVLDAVAAKGLTITAPEAGDTFLLGGATLTAVSNYTGDDLNNASIMLRLTYGDVTFLFTGDAEEEAEIAALETGLVVDSDVLKVGHHGSRTSTSPRFLAAVSPTDAVISCGTNNDYGHPHTEAVQRLSVTNLRRTDLHGTIVATSDGTTIVWSNAPVDPAGTSEISFVLNNSTMKFHLPTCSSAKEIAAKNRENTMLDKSALIAAGYSPCGRCKP